jgi:hypothetical protein
MGVFKTMIDALFVASLVMFLLVILNLFNVDIFWGLFSPLGAITIFLMCFGEITVMRL